MKRATKAALISGLVFPGTGHLYLKKYLVGSLLFIVAFICVYDITITAMQTAQQIVDQIQQSNGQANLNELLEQASKQSAQDANQYSGLSSTLFALFWFGGIIDAYRLGRQQDKNNLSQENNP
jgi:hypothetical protein